MARYCGNCIGAICDFCAFYDFNADDEGCYSGDGYCRFWRRQSDPDDGCDRFVCRHLQEGDAGFAQPTYRQNNRS